MSCKPNTRALRSTSNSPNYRALLGTRTNSDNDSKRVGAGMDIVALPLAVIVIIETFIVQQAINVTLIAAIVLIKKIRIRTVKLVRVIVTATVKEIVVIMTKTMVVILVVLAAVVV